MNLYDALTEYTASDAYPFHMPGHKRRAASLCDPQAIDITEIDGFDNLHHAEGILLESQIRAAKLYGSDETHFLVNGSTAGILSAIGACILPGSCLLMARNSHRSAFNAAALSRAKCAYLYPSPPSCSLSLYFGINGPIDPAQVELALAHTEDVRAVFLTSPTYDGVVSDVAKIAEIVHRHNLPLIVDEAHGAHFGMHPVFPESSVKLGADLVIHSLHKTLPALTQTALIHVNGSLVDRARLRRLLSVYQTSSPSYVLMASIDRCVRLLSENGRSLFDAYAERLCRFYRETRLTHLTLLRTDDPSRILIHPPSSAMELYHTLRGRFHLQPEMASVFHVLMLSCVSDDDEGFSRLSDALEILDREYGKEGERANPEPLLRPEDFPADECGPGAVRPDIVCTIAEALDAKSVKVPFASSEGRVSAEFLLLYPPGIPLLAPGERIHQDLIRRAAYLRQKGYSLQGPEDFSLNTIRILPSMC